jgi:hypothetical protein
MKKIFTLWIVGVLLFYNPDLFAQSLSSGSPALFGIDGDIKSNYRLVGSWDPTGTHDWFKNSGTTILGVVDTTGAASVNTHLITGENYVFNTGMSVPRYSVQDGYLVLDTRYARDYFGYSASGPTSDLTTFGASQKNGFAPNNWITAPLGGAVADKSDIIDTYVHMRRNGSTISSSNHLIVMMGANTVSNNGNRYFDIEFFVSKLNYNSSTGSFSNSGPAITGGHTAWAFNADGTVQQFGDMTIAFSFGGSSFNEVSIWIWVSSVDFSTVDPASFDFVPGEFHGATPGALYGYAKITPNPGNSLAAWGVVNTSITNAPAWGTNSKTLGSSGNNYYSLNYDNGQLGEAALDLTALGIDPALQSGSNPCSPPFTRVLVKSRASSSFTSVLQDFAGPYDFLDALTSSAAISSPGILSCTNSSITLSPLSYQSGGYYNWSTSNGNIVSRTDTPFVVIGQPGKYYLTNSSYIGCSQAIDSVIVQEDKFKPKATANTSGFLDPPQVNTVILYGGDTTASKYSTPYSSYNGLDWWWTGPNGFTSISQNPATSDTGFYRLIVKQKSNGCMDSAFTTVHKVIAVLPVKLISFQGNLNNNKIILKWTVGENENTERFEVERSFDGTNFTTIGLVFASEKMGTENYMFYENINNTGKVYYRLEMIDKNQKADYSKTLVFQVTSNEEKNKLIIINNPVTDKLTCSFQSATKEKAEFKVYDITGRIWIRQSFNIYEGSNLLSLPLPSSFSTGIYIVELANATEHYSVKFMKQ